MKTLLLFLCLLPIEVYASPVSAETSLQFSMVVGGKRGERPLACTTDAEGNCYIIGSSSSPDFPFTVDDPDLHIDKTGKYFIMKLSPGGDILSITSPAFVNRVKDCMFDKTGNLLVLCYENDELLLLRASPDGKDILSSQIISGVDHGRETLTVDQSGRIYVAGSVKTDEFPATPNAWQTSLAGDGDAFIMVFSPDLETCEYATYFGGTEGEYINDIEIDYHGNIHVVGSSTSDDFPVTDNAFNILTNGFYAVFDPTLSDLVFCTCLFGTYYQKLAVDSRGNGIISGLPQDFRIPFTGHSYDSGVLNRDNILVMSIDPFTPAINYAAYIAGDESRYGGSRSESCTILVDSGDHPIAVGLTSADNYPVTADAYQSERAFDTKYYAYGGGNLSAPVDTVVSEFDETGTSLLYSTYVGGGRSDMPRCATLDRDGNLWIAGQTESTDFPADLKIQYHEVFNEGDIFVCKFSRSSRPTAVDEDQKPSPLPTITAYPNPFNPSTTVSFTLPESGHASLAIYNLAGQKVRTLADEPMATGNHTVVWDGRDDNGNAVAAGVYVTRFTAGDATATGKMVLVK